jgi:hypothetical protein
MYYFCNVILQIIVKVIDSLALRVPIDQRIILKISQMIKPKIFINRIEFYTLNVNHTRRHILFHSNIVSIPSAQRSWNNNVRAVTILGRARCSSLTTYEAAVKRVIASARVVRGGFRGNGSAGRLTR